MQPSTSTMNRLDDRGRRCSFWHDGILGLDFGRASGASSRFRRHSHETFIIVATESGSLCATVNDSSFVLRRDQVLILHPDEPHSGTPDSRSGWSFRAYYPEIETIAAAVEEVTGLSAAIPRFPTVLHSAGIAHALLSAHCSIETGQAHDRELAYLVALNVLAGCSVATPAVERQPDASKLRIRFVKEVIQSRYAEPIRLRELARLAGCGPFQLMRAFERQVGVSVHSYLTQVRLRHACRLLAYGEPEADVAIRVGFSDQSHLIRRFKQAFGVTPGFYAQNSH